MSRHELSKYNHMSKELKKKEKKNGAEWHKHESFPKLTAGLQVHWALRGERAQRTQYDRGGSAAVK